MENSEMSARPAEVHRPHTALEDALMFAGSLAVATVYYKYGAEINSFLATSGTQVLEQFFHDAS